MCGFYFVNLHYKIGKTMIKKALYCLFLVIFVLASCKKSDNIQDDNSKPFTFTSLSVSDTVVTVSSFLTLTAVADGDELNYTWDSKDIKGTVYGSFVGGGSSIQWNVCHPDIFNITCTVKDKYNHSESKTVKVRSHL